MKTKKLEELELLINDVKSGENKYCVIFHGLDGSYTHDYDVIIYRFNKIVNCTSAKLILKDNLEPALAFYNEGKEVEMLFTSMVHGHVESYWVNIAEPCFLKGKYRIKEERPKMPFVDWHGEDAKDAIFALVDGLEVEFYKANEIEAFFSNLSDYPEQIIIMKEEDNEDE